MNEETIQTKLFNNEQKETETEFAITLASIILGVIGGYGIMGTRFYGGLLPNFYSWILFCSILILQAMITIFHELEIIPFSLWG